MNLRIGITLPLIFLFFIGLSFGSTFTAFTTAASSDEPEINYMAINTVIDNNYAVTTIEEEFENPHDHAIDDMFTVQIPERAFISNFSLTIDNTTYYARVVPKEEAKQEYNEAVESGNNAALVESYGKSTFSYSISLAPEQKIIVTLKYEEFIEKTLGDYNYKLYLTSGNINSKVEKLSIDIDIKSELIVTDVSVDNYKDTTDITYDSKNRVFIKYETDVLPPKYDLDLTYTIEPVHINGKMFNYYSDGYYGYFSHVFSPQPDDLGGTPMAKDIIFVLDKSGSMAGTKIEQLKDAFDEIVHELRSADYFNIVMFNDRIIEYQSELIPASDANKNDAANYISEIYASGSTNIDGALTTGLDMFGDTSETVPIIVFLTDGLPTYGETNTMQIRRNIMEHNVEDVAIFSLGFGTDVDFDFLKALSLENEGHALRIDVGEDAAEQLTNFYDTISTPLLKDLSFEYMDGATEVYPTFVEQLFEGSEIVVTGRYDVQATDLSCNVYTTGSDGKRTFSQTFSMEQETEHSFIPRLWAYMKIQHLLDKITVEGSNETAQGEITNLALEYEFVTPYTSLLITTEDQKEEENEEEEEVVPPDDTNLNNDPDDQTTNTGTTSHSADTYDSDGDGYPDNIDAFPSDPTRWKTQNQPSFTRDGNYTFEPPESDKKEDAGDIIMGAGGSILGICILITFIIGITIVVILISIIMGRKNRQI